MLTNPNKVNSCDYTNQHTGLEHCVVCGKKFPLMWETTRSDNEAAAAKKSKPADGLGGWWVWHGKRRAHAGLFCTLQCALAYATASALKNHEAAERKRNEKFGDEMAAMWKEGR